jgi:transcriptional regulator with XRE-family HTH domain
MLQKEHTSAFGNSVVALLGARGWTKTKLAVKMGKSLTYVSQVTTGHSNPSPRVVNAVADVLELNSEQRFNLHMDAAMDYGFFRAD